MLSMIAAHMTQRSSLWVPTNCKKEYIRVSMTKLIEDYVSQRLLCVLQFYKTTKSRENDDGRGQGAGGIAFMHNLHQHILVRDYQHVTDDGSVHVAEDVFAAANCRQQT